MGRAWLLLALAGLATAAPEEGGGVLWRESLLLRANRWRLPAAPVLEDIQVIANEDDGTDSARPALILEATTAKPADQDVPKGVVVYAALATLGGSLSAMGANVLAYPAHITRTTGKVFSAGQNYLTTALGLAFTLGGIAAFASSTSLGGAVATVLPIQVGANLLVNMLLQVFLGIKYFNKSMRLGTLVLLCAVAELSELGPDSPADITVQELLAPVSVIWLLFLLVCMLGLCVGCYYTRPLAHDDPAKLFCFVMVTTLSSVIGGSISKSFGIFKDNTFHLGLAFLCYALDGIICLGATLISNKECDISIWVPSQLASMLVVNMFTGLFVWGDAQYIKKPLAYVLVYFICILGVYLISPEMDVIGDLVRKRHVMLSHLSEGTAPTPLGQAVLELRDVWKKQSGQTRPVDELQQQACRKALEQAMANGLETGAITTKEVATLAMMLIEEMGVGPNAVVVRWLEQEVKHFGLYRAHDPTFQDQLRNTLSPEELRKTLEVPRRHCYSFGHPDQERPSVTITNLGPPTNAAAVREVALTPRRLLEAEA